MKAEYSKCGFNCAACPSYRKNLRTKKDRQRCSDGWFEYFGFRLTPQKLRRCDGCQSEKKDAVRYVNCTIRKCAVMNGIENCARCTEFENCRRRYEVIPCHYTREKVERALGVSVPEKDYRAFIEPFENCRHLDGIRRSVGRKDTVRPKEIRAKTAIVAFPEDMKGAPKQKRDLRRLHAVLSSIISIRGKTFAQHEIMRKRRARYFMHLLWVFGLYGEHGTAGGRHLLLDASVHESEKLEGNYARVQAYLKMLRKLGVKVAILKLPGGTKGGKGMLTPTGWLRGEGWKMKMVFADGVGGGALLKALQAFTGTLDRVHGTDGYRRFLKADMTVFKKEGK